MVMKAQLPDGTLLEFPDGTSDDVINSAVLQHLNVQPQTSRLAREVVGGVAGLGEGLGRFTRGVIQTGADIGGALGLPTEGIRQAVAEEQQAQEQKFDEQFGDAISPKVTQVIGETLPAVALPASRATTLGAQALAGGVGGGIASAVQPQSEIQSPEQALEQRASQGLVGGAVGAVATPGLGAVTGGVKRLFRKAPDKATSTPLLGDVDGGVDDIAKIEQTQQTLGSEATKLNKSISKAFERAQELGSKASIKNSNISRLSDDLKEKALSTIDDEQASIYLNASKRLDDLAEKGDVSVNKLQGLRRAATQASQGGGSKGFASGDVKRSIDDFLDESLQNKEILGDPSAIRQWKRAIDLRKEFGNRFESSKVVSNAIQEGSAPERISSQIFGGGSVSNARDASKVFDEVLKGVGTENRKEAETLLKQSVVNKMFRTSTRGGEVGNESVWIRGLANEIQKLRKNNPSLFKKFSKKEQMSLNNLEKELRKSDEAGVLNKVAEFAFGFINRNPLLKVQLPTPFAPQRNMSVDDIIGLINLNPRVDDIPQALSIINRTAGASAGLGLAEE